MDTAFSARVRNEKLGQKKKMHTASMRTAAGGRALAFPTLIAAPDLYALKMVRESGIRCGRVPNMVKNRAGSEDTV